MDNYELKQITQKIREAHSVGNKELYGELLLEAYEYCFNNYLSSCRSFRITKDPKLEKMIIGLKDSLDNLGRLHTENIEDMNDLD